MYLFILFFVYGQKVEAFSFSFWFRPRKLKIVFSVVFIFERKTENPLWWASMPDTCTLRTESAAICYMVLKFNFMPVLTAVSLSRETDGFK